MRLLLLFVLLCGPMLAQFRYQYNPFSKKMDIVGYESIFDDGTNVTITGRNLKVSTTILNPHTIGAGANQLPAAAPANAGWLRIVTDGSTSADCVTGGGVQVVLCRSNGTVWANLSGAPGGGGLADPGGNGIVTRTALNTTGVAAAANVTGLFSGSGDFLKSDGTKGTPIGTGDVVGPASSVDTEIALFSATTGKLLKRATQTGILKSTGGVLGTATAGTDFAPATSGTGVLKGSGTGGTATAQVADITGLFTGSGEYLKSDGTKGTPLASGLTWDGADVATWNTI